MFANDGKQRPKHPKIDFVRCPGFLVIVGCLTVPDLIPQEPSNNFILLLSCQVNELSGTLPFTKAFQLSKSQPVDTLQSNAEAADCPINVIDDSGLSCPRVGTIPGNYAFRDC